LRESNYWQGKPSDLMTIQCELPVRGKQFFTAITPNRYQFYNNTLSTVIFFWLYTLKDTAEPPAADL